MGQITIQKDLGGIQGLCLITPAVHGDARGHFMDTYNERDLAEAGIAVGENDIVSLASEGSITEIHVRSISARPIIGISWKKDKIGD